MTSWRERAACRDEDGELFFPDASAYQSGEAAYALTFCHRCPVAGACLAFAMDNREKVGIWGGLTPEERARLHRRERRYAGKRRALQPAGEEAT